MWFALLIAALTAYLLGNLNGAVCISQLIAKEDIRSHGSGNAGLTNFIRQYGRRSALAVIAIDGGKAVIGCLSSGLILAPHLTMTEGMIYGGFFVMLGHVFPALLGFRGGKGILSGFLVAMVVDWRVGLIILAVFLAAYLLTQYVSLGSVLAAVAFAAGFVVFHHEQVLVMVCGLAMSALTIFMHRSNIVRLWTHTERKTNLFGKGKSA